MKLVWPSSRPIVSKSTPASNRPVAYECRNVSIHNAAHGRSRTHYYYACTRQNHEGGKYSCQAPRIPAEALENALIERIRELGRVMEAREKIVERALECLDGESVRLKQEEDVLRRQQQKTKADIGRLVEVLKSLGVRGLPSVQAELHQLEREEKDIRRQLAVIEKRQAPTQAISGHARRTPARNVRLFRLRGQPS